MKEVKNGPENVEWVEDFGRRKMIEKKTKVVFVTDDGVEHLSESDAVFHEYYSLYRAAMSTKRGQNYWNETLKAAIIDSPIALVNLFIIEPLLLPKLEQVIWFRRNPSSTLQDFEERKKNVT
jgi:hypothetical protein